MSDESKTADGWQTMDTAPTEAGARILAVNADGEHRIMRRYLFTEDAYHYVGDGLFRKETKVRSSGWSDGGFWGPFDPVMWMPLTVPQALIAKHGGA